MKLRLKNKAKKSKQLSILIFSMFMFLGLGILSFVNAQHASAAGICDWYPYYPGCQWWYTPTPTPTDTPPPAPSCAGGYDGWSSSCIQGFGSATYCCGGVNFPAVSNPDCASDPCHGASASVTCYGNDGRDHSVGDTQPCNFFHDASSVSEECQQYYSQACQSNGAWGTCSATAGGGASNYCSDGPFTCNIAAGDCSGSAVAPICTFSGSCDWSNTLPCNQYAGALCDAGTGQGSGTCDGYGYCHGGGSNPNGSNTPTPAAIGLNPTSLTFAAVSGGATPNSQTFSISNSGTDTMNWNASTNQSWCHISPASGTNNSTEIVSVDSPSNVGSFNCTVTVSSVDAANSPQAVSVTYNVSSAPSDGASCVSVTTDKDTYNAGDAISGIVVMQNSGTTTWQSSAPSPYRLGSSNPQDNMTWGLKRVDLQSGDVAPSTQSIFAFSATAPGSAGIYDFNWQMVHDNVGWFGNNCSKNLTVLSPNQPPVASNVSVTEPDYCSSGPSVIINWTYSDAESESQAAYEVQIARDAGFNNISKDSGDVISSATSYFVGNLFSGRTYWARVKVGDASGESSWQNQTICTGPGCVGGTHWTTPSHPYPTINFTWSPTSPAAKQPAQFIDQSSFYDSTVNHSWQWVFGDNNSSNQQNPLHAYADTRGYNVTLTATDGDGYSCSLSQIVNTQKAFPVFKEVAPK